MWDLEICCLRHGAKTSSAELSCHRSAAAGSLQQGSIGEPSSDHCGLTELQGWLEPLPGGPALQGQHRETENHSRSHQRTIWSSPKMHAIGLRDKVSVPRESGEEIQTLHSPQGIQTGNRLTVLTTAPLCHAISGNLRVAFASQIESQ